MHSPRRLLDQSRLGRRHRSCHAALTVCGGFVDVSSATLASTRRRSPRRLTRGRGIVRPDDSNAVSPVRIVDSRRMDRRASRRRPHAHGRRAAAQCRESLDLASEKGRALLERAGLRSELRRWTRAADRGEERPLLVRAHRVSPPRRPGRAGVVDASRAALSSPAFGDRTHFPHGRAPARDARARVRKTRG